MKRKLLFLLLSFCIVLAACGNGAEEAKTSDSQEKEENGGFPEKDINLIIPFAAGGASDMVSRAVGVVMEDKLGVPVIPVNKEGGSGAVGMSFVEQSQNDGYTVGYVPVELTMLKALGYSDLGPDNFDLLARPYMIPAAITVPADAPYDSIEEFVEFAKQNPKEVKVGNSGTGSIWHIAAAAFAQETGVELSYVPFDGAAPAVAALLGGHIDAVSVSPSEVKSNLDSGELKVLAVMSEDRDDMLPDVPTLKELGYDLEIVAWGGFVVPKGTPDDVKKVLEDAIKEAVDSDDFNQIVEERGFVKSYMGPDEFAKFANEQYEFFQELIPAIDLEE